MKSKITQAAVQRWIKNAPIKAVDVYCQNIGGFVARVRPSGTVSYFLKYETASGKSRNYTIGRDGKDGMNATVAGKHAVRIKQLVRDGKDPHKEKLEEVATAQENATRTLGRYFNERYLPRYVSKRSERGAEEAERMLRSNFSHLFDKPIADIRPDDIEVWQAAMEKKGRQSDTIKRIRGELESLYSHAMKEPIANWKWIVKNPLADLIPIPSKPIEELKPRFLGEDESSRLLGALRDRDADKRAAAASGNSWRKSRHLALKKPPPIHFIDHLEVMVIISLKTGLRRNELFSLEWRDVAQDFTEISVRASITKTLRSRIIPLSPLAQETMSKWKEQSTDKSLVFSNGGEKFKDVKRSWIGILDRANIKEFRWHDMRHDFASQLVIRNVSIQKVSKLLGHRSIKTTQRYAHLNNKSLVEAVELLG